MYKKLSCAQAKKLIDAGEIVVADLRDKSSYESDHIDGAFYLSAKGLGDFCNEIISNKPVILYCGRGIASHSIARHLVDHGFSSVYILAGGYESWKEFHTT